VNRWQLIEMALRGMTTHALETGPRSMRNAHTKNNGTTNTVATTNRCCSLLTFGFSFLLSSNQMYENDNEDDETRRHTTSNIEDEERGFLREQAMSIDVNDKDGDLAIHQQR